MTESPDQSPSENPSVANPASPESSHESDGHYVVIARRYRPQSFDELLGQQHVARSLSNAISGNRVGHAYLFCGARGVGKTSAARILAKALNCVNGPTDQPCNVCDVCRSISQGNEIDVLEIDGASNRGIDEIRDLRQNVSVRPSRGRYKIYIIDEVHMLTNPAFNALLKTLEEPPEHVKFVFCTTEPEKIPITILSRCQRFDFSSIDQVAIVGRLQQIVQSEGLQADQAALELLARRAGGSMRDSQSLLEQLLAFGDDAIGVQDVHRLLGTASDERMGQVMQSLIQRDVPAAMAQLEAALDEGVDVGQFVEQLFGYLRDTMVAAAGCKPEGFLYASRDQSPHVVESAHRLGLETTLAAMQIVEQTLARLRYCTQGRTLAELALVRICQLDELEAVSQLIDQLRAAEAEQPDARTELKVQSRRRGPAASDIAPPVTPPAEAASAEAMPPEAARPEATTTEKVQPEAGPPEGKPLEELPPEASTADPDPSESSPPRLNSSDTATPELATSELAASQVASPHGEPTVVSESESAGSVSESDELVADSTATEPETEKSPSPQSSQIELTESTLVDVWQAACEQLDGMLRDAAENARPTAIPAPNVLVLTFPANYTAGKNFLEQAARRQAVERAISAVTGKPVRVEFEVLAPSNHAVEAQPTKATMGAKERESVEHVMDHPFVRKAAQLFKAEPVKVDRPD